MLGTTAGLLEETVGELVGDKAVEFSAHAPRMRLSKTNIIMIKAGFLLIIITLNFLTQTQ